MGSADAELVYMRRMDDFLDQLNYEKLTATEPTDCDNDDHSNDDLLRTMPIEIKSRLSHSTFYDERGRLRTNRGLEAWENDQPDYVELHAEKTNSLDGYLKAKNSFNFYITLLSVMQGKD